MLKLEFFGFFNSSFKFKSSNTFTTGFINFYLFICFCKKILNIKNLKFSFSFFKKNNCDLSFIKSNFKYKVSKHLVSKYSNKFRITLLVSNFIIVNNIFKIIKNFNLVSTTYLNINHLKIKNLFKNKIFFLI